MSALLLMFCWLPPAVSVSGVPPAPQNLHVKSVNLRHVLQWERGVGTSPEVTYSVSYHTDSGQRIVVCERVQEPLLCDLTLACSEPDEIYHLQVTAHQHSAQSSMSWDGFHPIKHTELQPPVLQVAICNSSLCIDMDTPVPQLHSIYENLWYELKVERDGTQLLMKKLIRSLRREVIPGVRAGSQYCVSVRFADRIVPRESSFGPPQCVLLSPSPTPPSSAAAGHGLLISGLLLLLLFLVVFVTVYLSQEKPALPSVLTSVHHCEEKLEVTCHPAVSSRLFIEVAPTEEQSEYCSSDTDSSDGEQEEPGGSVHTAQYKSKTSLSSQHGSAASQVHPEEQEEVNLLTLTFSRDKEPDPSTGLLYEEELQPCEEELSLCELTTQQTELLEESEEESFQTGYMSHPAVF